MSGTGLDRAGADSAAHVWESPLPDDLLDGIANASDADVSDAEADAVTSGSHSILEHGWWPVVAWAAGLLIGSRQLSDNSFLTHLATGRIMRDTGAPHVDVFTFASGGKPIVVQSWLASWWYATLDAIGGGTAIRLFITAVCGLLLAVLWRLTRPAGTLVARVALTAMAGMVGLLWWGERPQTIGFLAMALAVLVVQERRNPAWLVPLFAVWVNVHGSFPLGMVFVGALVAIRVIAGRRFERRDALDLAAVAAGVLLGAAVSPYGMEMLTFPLQLLGRSSTLAFITEWRPLSFTSGGAINISNVVFVAEAVAICALLVLRRQWLRLLVAALFIGMALTAVRNVAIAALVLIPLAAPVFAGLGTPDTVAPQPRRRLVVAGAVVAALVVAFVVATPAYDLSPYPTRAVDWMEAHGYVGDGADEPRVLTHDYVGNYLEWRFGPAANVWLDDRAELHGFAVARDYVFLLSHIGNADSILDRNPHDLVLWSADDTLARHLAHDDAYRIVYRDQQAVVACRVSSDRC